MTKDDENGYIYFDEDNIEPININKVAKKVIMN